MRSKIDQIIEAINTTLVIENKQSMPILIFKLEKILEEKKETKDEPIRDGMGYR